MIILLDQNMMQIKYEMDKKKLTVTICVFKIKR